MNEGFHLFPHAASTIAGPVDALTIGLLAFSAVTLLIVFGLIVTFGSLYYRGSPRSRKSKKPGGQVLLEVGWTSVTTVFFFVFFVWGALLYMRMHEPPANAEEITVVAKQWMWKIQHPTGQRELNELHVPVGHPVRLLMTSQDVIHSFFVPEFRVKQDVLPGRYVQMWFEATQAGEYNLFCTQYCGTLHAGMRGRVIAMAPADYQAWLQNGLPGQAARTTSMADRGRALFTRLGCISCHDEHTKGNAPPLYGLYGGKAFLSDGATVIADENYLRESILNPGAKIVEGYQPIMPSFAGVASEEDVLDLIAFIKALQATPNGGVDR